MPEETAKASKGGPPAWPWSESFWRLLFPPRCLTCEALLPPPPGLPLCRSCQRQFTPAGLICPRCGTIFRLGQPCGCPLDTLPLKGLYALSWYEGAWRRMLHRLKFEQKRSLARPLGRWLGELVARETAWEPELVIPVPLHRRRLAERGYNQALLLARFAAQALQLPLRPLLVKPKPTLPQSSLSYQQRRENVRGAFAYRGKPLPGKRALLVDDIYSTGATMQEAARVLSEQGLIVYGAAAAFTPRLSPPC
ncbi:MAG TPA: ComF family protein [Bacillota bacterium]|nr:ComF family protein [Bacillota bacterium]